MSITAKKLQKPLIVNGQNILPLTSMDQVLTDDEGSRLNETIHQNLAPIELTSTATRAYAVGEFLVYDNLLYRVTSAIALGGTITPGANCVTDKVGDEIKTIKDALSRKNYSVSSMFTPSAGWTLKPHAFAYYTDNGFVELFLALNASPVAQSGGRYTLGTFTKLNPMNTVYTMAPYATNANNVLISGTPALIRSVGDVLLDNYTGDNVADVYIHISYYTADLP